MRLPTDPLPPAPPAADLYEISEPAAVRPIRFVQARSRPPLIVPAKRQRPPAEANSTPQPPAAPLVQERRRGERRVAQLPVLLDTRSGRDRRRSGSGPDAAPSIDVEV